MTFGWTFAWASAILSFAFAAIDPYHLNMFWQIPDGVEILQGHFPSTVSYAIASGPLVSQEWMYEAALAWATTHQLFGAFALVCGVAAAATPLLVYAAVRAFGIGEVGAGIAALLVVGSRFAGSAARPETFAIDAFAFELLVLARGRGAAWVVLTTVLWANLHASVVIAPVTALVYALVQAVAIRKIDDRVRHAFGVAALALAATFVTPFGLRLWSYAVALTFGGNPVRHYLDAWKPLSFDAPGTLTAVLPGLLLLVCFGAVTKRKNAGELAIAALFFALTLAHARYATFLVVAWAPAIARMLEERTRIGAFSLSRPVASLIALVPFVYYAAGNGIGVSRMSAESPGPWRAGAALIAEHKLHGNAYAPYQWAAYLHWHDLPVRLLIDSHGDPYPSDVWRDHLALQGVRSNWLDVIDRRRITLVVMPLDSPLSQALLLTQNWRKVDVRDGIAAFVRRS